MNKEIFYSLTNYMLLFDHIISGYILLTLLNTLKILGYDVESSSFLSYTLWAIPYLLKLPVILITYHIKQQYKYKTLIIANAAWIISLIVLISSQPKLLLLALIRSTCLICNYTEQALIRPLVLQINEKKIRKKQIIKYPIFASLGYFISYITSQFIGYTITIYLIIFLSSIICFYRYKNINIDFFNIQKTTQENKTSNLYCISGMCISYLAYQSSIFYGQQISYIALPDINIQTKITSCLLIYQILLYICLEKTSWQDAKIIKKSSILLLVFLTIFFTINHNIYIVSILRFILTTLSVIFDIYFYQSLKNKLSNKDSSISLNINLSYWLSSLIYGKIIPIILIYFHNNFITMIILSFLILTPPSIVLINKLKEK